MNNTEKSEVAIARRLKTLLDRGIQEGFVECANVQLDEDFAGFFFASFEWLHQEGLARCSKIERINGVQKRTGSGSANSALISYEHATVGWITKTTDKAYPVANAVTLICNEGTSSWARGNVSGGFTKSWGRCNAS